MEKGPSSIDHQVLSDPVADQHRLPGCKQALIRLLPRDPYSLIASIGVLAGIGYYAYSQNPWLLLLFIGILFGKRVIEHLPPPR